MLYQIKDGTVSAGGQTILSHIDFYIKEKEKIAVVGKNGAGKTTLLRLLAGELTPDRDDSRGSYGRSNDMVTGAATAGSDLDGTAKRTQRAKKKKPSGNPETGITMSRNITIDMLRQADKSNQDLTIEQMLLESCPDKDTFSKERFDYEMEYDRLFTGFGFEKSDKTRLFRSFSGGEQTKISLIKLLLKKPDLLLLDEPTNHMDIPAKETLESAFKAYTGTMLFVSHDRYFIKQVADAILVFENDKVMYYPFGYDHYISRLKASQDGNLPALMQAKDAAMVEALAAVPKRERHETRQLSTEEAYLEWKLALAAEPVVKAAEEAEKVYEELCEAESELNEENVDKLRLQYEKVADSWTNECTKWYDIYLDEMYPESDF